MFYQYLEFEKPILDLESRLDELRRDGTETERRRTEIARLERRLAQTKADIYGRLTPWQRTLIARHPARPYFLDYVGLLATDFVELHGDRLYGDDQSMVAGLAMFGGRGVAMVGHQKGRNVKENVVRNFGMSNPEGYRKALRVMRLAEKFRKPVFTFIDTPGAYPGIGAEERGQAEAIARNIFEMSRLATPVVAVVIGEGGSGGALAIGVADRVLMLEHAVYSVISPEACAAILWRDDRTKVAEAAEALRLDAASALNLGIIDQVVPEPQGGAHRDPGAAAAALRDALAAHLAELDSMTTTELTTRRYEKFRRMGRLAGERDG